MANVKLLKEPTSRRDLPTREKIILLESSKLHGCIFPPWQDMPKPSEFDLDALGDAFVDDAIFHFSEVQQESFDAWRRPDQHSLKDEGREKSSPQQKHDLVQDIITDCSVVASLCAITARTDRGHSNIFQSSFNPFDQSADVPSLSKSGKYMFRFHFNGCYRRVVIDDRLPVSKTTRSLHVVDRNDPGVFWPAFVEKAYLKVRGGYDFPGSNSGTDLWVLTGWIPEQIFLQSDDLDRTALWQRIFKAFSYGDVLITMGTGKLTEKEERGMGLIGEHDYAVIDAREIHGQPSFLVKNPWSNGQIWKGHLERTSHLSALQNGVESLELNEKHTDFHKLESLSPGTFWIPINEIFQNFASIYLNWNPGLFSCRQDVHFKWDLTNSDSPRGFLGSNPQYTLKSTASGPVWLILTRHFASSTGPSRSEQTGLHKLESAIDPHEEFISLYAFENSAQRVFLSKSSVAHSPYVDSPNALLKLEVKPSKVLTIVVSEQALSRRVHSFSLSAFTTKPVDIALAGDVYHHSTSLNSAWTSSTSGGNASSPDYMINPQFCLTVEQVSNVSLFLHNPAEDWPVHVDLVWADGKQVRVVSERDVIGDSGEYRKGFAFAEIKDVAPGKHTIVCSTFEKGQTGRFVLRVASTLPFLIKPIQVASAGRFVTEAGTATFAPEEDRWILPLLPQRLTRLSAVAQSLEDSSARMIQSRSPFKISIELGRGPSRQTLGVSGGDSFADARHHGISTPELDVLPHAKGLWVVLERIGCSGIRSNERVRVQIISEAPSEVGSWIREESD